MTTDSNMITLLRPGTGSEAAAGANPVPVLLVVDGLAKTLGGGERIVLKLAALLPRYGYSPLILTLRADPDSPALSAPPCPVYLLPLTSSYDRTAIRAARQLASFIRDRHIRIVQTFFESSDLWAGITTRFLTSARLIWSRRDMGILRTSLHHAAYRILNRLPDAVFAVSEQVRQYSIHHDGMDPDHVHTVYNGLDLSASDTDSRTIHADAEAPSICSVGNIRFVKGYDVLLEAAAIVVRHYPRARFSIAGEVLESGYMSQLESSIAKLGLSDNVVFEGGINSLGPYLAQAGIFVLPSRSEGFSNAIIEAMAASLPVVATRVGGNAEAVSDGVNGIIVPPENPKALADAILYLLEDPVRARNMGAAGRLIASKRFTTEAMMRKTVNIYRILMSDG